MWRIILAQFRYNLFWVSTAYLVTGFFLLAGSLKLKDPAKVPGLVAFGLFAGILLGVYLWVRDIKERRAVVWLGLPVHPDAWLGVRLWTPVLVTLGFLGLHVLAWVVRAVQRGDLPFTEWAAEVLPLYGILLLVLVLFPFSEEMNIYLRERKWALYLFNGLAFVGMMVLVVIEVETEGAPARSLLTYGSAVAAALATAWAYRRRTSYLVVSHPVHGMPQDLASSSGRFSTR